jgi:retron-type reverse transcriptase
LHTYDDIISLENLLEAWKEFRKGKRKKLDVLEFQSDLIYQVTSLHEDLKNKTYQHGGYRHFRISDPKPRDIHKASVCDRLLHHALYRKLYPYFDRRFIHDSYSCRVGKGTHKAMNCFRQCAYRVSKNNTRTCLVLKCDIRKFFASIDQQVLLAILKKHILDQDIVWLLGEVIGSFPKGLPLGNLTSQLLVNIYMNEFDQFVKHSLEAKYYIRYADDFVILSHDQKRLQRILVDIEMFLEEKLRLHLHPDKVFIKTLASGVDFLGWVHFPSHRVLRTATKKRMFRRLAERKGSEGEEATEQSYLGMLLHGNANKLQQKIAVV